MNYKTIKASESDIPRLKDYKLNNIFDYAGELPDDEINRINSYVERNIPIQLENYKIICVNNQKIGCFLVQGKDDGVILDEIYLESEYRNKGIGTDIIKEVISKNEIIYLWVYKSNIKAIALYKKLGFQVIEETEARYYMKYDSKKISKYYIN